MKKKSRKSVVWIWRDSLGDYCVNGRRPSWDCDSISWDSPIEDDFCECIFERLFPFFTMPPNSLGKITNTENTLTFEIVETK